MDNNEIVMVLNCFDNVNHAILIQNLDNKLREFDKHYRKCIIRECINAGILEIDRLIIRKQISHVWVALSQTGIRMWLERR